MRSRHFLHLVRKIFHWRAVLIGLHETSGHIEAKVSKRWIDETTHRYSPGTPRRTTLTSGRHQRRGPPFEGIAAFGRLQEIGLIFNAVKEPIWIPATTPRRGIRRQRAHACPNRALALLV
jgi:hypothetical protein